MSITTYGPYTWQNAQYRLVKNVGGTWDLQDVSGRTLATFLCKRGMGPNGPFWAWTYQGKRLALDPRGAVNTWLAARQTTEDAA